MNYEELYEALKDVEKNLDTAVKSAVKESKNIAKGTESGELKNVDKAVASLQTAVTKQQEFLNEVKVKLESFDRKAYFSDGDFEQQLVLEAEKKNIDVLKKGPGIYEMFPNKVTIYPESQEVGIDKKRTASLRPSIVAEAVAAAQVKLRSGSFNEQRFLDELENAYDLVILKKNPKKRDASVKLTDVYKMLVPMGRLKNAYDAQMFAFDLGRLYASGVTSAKDGRVMELVPARNNSEGIRVVNENGAEEYFVQISFHE